MTEDADRLRRALADLRGHARSVRFLRLSGWALLVSGLALMVLFGFRRRWIDLVGEDPLGLSPVPLAALAALAVCFVLLVLRIAILVSGPRASTVARRADESLVLQDLVVSGLCAVALPGAFAKEVVRRAATALADVDPGEVYPTGRSWLHLVATVPFVLAALYLFAFPPFVGPDPFRLGGGRSGGAAGAGGGPHAESDGAPPGRPEPGTDDRDRTEESGEPTVPAAVAVVVIPAKRI
ncbi:MAG: hypothetical protein ACYTDY_19565, partial [Planctomycetota bacterium]